MQYHFEEYEAKYKKLIKEIAITVIGVLIAICLAFLTSERVLEKTTVIGSSMDTTLSAESQILINKMTYRFTEPERFDIIVFKQSDEEHSYYNVKRIIGLPGETIQIQGGVVYINGTKLEETIEVEEISNAGLAESGITLDEDEFFVLGDNRNQSEDSRFANIGNIVKDDIIGKAWIVLKPFNFISKLNKKAEE